MRVFYATPVSRLPTKLVNAALTMTAAKRARCGWIDGDASGMARHGTA
jgi:hypothetical protein